MTAWLIEMAQCPRWWRVPSAFSDKGEFVQDASQAVRFARREDAQAVIDWLGLPARPTEHVWIPPLTGRG